ncbi:MAG: hypothetical protein JRN35_02685 [Nitrososphaerota archaeon]|nr:hypothetical protein [Nitrososphaerota archaeon]MDG6943247.1 hypothetical protein [Nitrososphaerota archaeon]
MGWGARMLAVLAGLIALGLGAWPIFLLALVYLVYSFRKPRAQRAVMLKQQVLARPRRPWGRYTAGGVLFLLALAAVEAGGTLSPIAFFTGGLAVVFWPLARRHGVGGGVVPMTDSILLRSRLFPLRWHALAEVKLEAQDQTRGVAALDGRLLVFAGRSPSAFQVVSVYALGYRGAEEKVLRTLRCKARMLSQRGAHLLPLDSRDAGKRLSLTLDRLDIGTEDLEAVSSLPFDVFAVRTKEGLVVSHRAFRLSEPAGTPSIPPSDLTPARQPLFAEVVEKIQERHGWPGPDAFSPFLAALDASRTEPFSDRVMARGEAEGKVSVETPGGAEVKLTRAQLRAVARIYA